MKNLTPEIIEKAKAAKSAEELLEVAKAGGIEMTADEAATYFAQLNPKSGELNDDDLDSVAGGACLGTIETPSGRIRVTSGQTCPDCGGTEGYVSANGAYGKPTVRCPKCMRNFVFFDDCTYEVIG